MAIHWHLKTHLAKSYNIYKVIDIQKKIIEKTGTLISLQNLCNLLNKKPSQVRLSTMEIICSALDCKLEDFLRIEPKKYKTDKVLKLSFKNTPHSKRAVLKFPDPKNYDG